MQSSDGELFGNTSLQALTDDEKCTDHLSPDRLALLHLVQVAKLKIEKLNLFSMHNASSLIEKVNRIEQKTQKEEHKTVKKSSRPPIPNSPTTIRKKSESLGQSFFIEYQFPVTANSREAQEWKNSSSSAFMATQIMRVNASKRLNSAHSDEAIDFENMAEYSVLFNSGSLETWWRSAILFKVYCRSSLGTASTQPYLVGVAKLELKNVLKSRNFKLYKKLGN